jgi:hypothetical protein
MAIRKNEFHIVAFDPGGVIGWAHLVIDFRAFITPRNKVLANLLRWDTGEFKGTEHANIGQCVELVRSARYGQMPFHSKTDAVTEDFELTQIVGGHNLLSPVRLNAILGWEIGKVGGVNFVYQKRQMRTGVTRERLKLMGLKPVGKDSFAALQHGVTWARRVKQEANRRPWKLE